MCCHFHQGVAERQAWWSNAPQFRVSEPDAIDPPRPGVRWDLPATLAILAANESTAAGGGAFNVDKLMRGQDD